MFFLRVSEQSRKIRYSVSPWLCQVASPQNYTAKLRRWHGRGQEKWGQEKWKERRGEESRVDRLSFVILEIWGFSLNCFGFFLNAITSHVLFEKKNQQGWRHRLLRRQRSCWYKVAKPVCVSERERESLANSNTFCDTSQNISLWGAAIFFLCYDIRTRGWWFTFHLNAAVAGYHS